jgi:hypothetical protein
MSRLSRYIKEYWLFFLLGALVFVAVLWMASDRRPVVEQTDFHVDPSAVRPGQRVDAVWTDKTLRARCNGVVFPRIVGMKDGQLQTFGAPPRPPVGHNVVGKTETFRTVWKIPELDHGSSGYFDKRTNRWCNIVQEWLWPMKEETWAPFTVE